MTATLETPPTYTARDREIIAVLIDVQTRAIGILTALRRIHAITST